MGNTLETTWVSGGDKKSVETKRMDGESDEDFQARHDLAVVFWMRVFPEDQ